MQDDNFTLSAVLTDELKLFIQEGDVPRIARNLRKVFFDYLKFQEGLTDNNFGHILSDIETLLELLDAFDDEKNGRNKPT